MQRQRREHPAEVGVGRRRSVVTELLSAASSSRETGRTTTVKMLLTTMLLFCLSAESIDALEFKGSENNGCSSLKQALVDHSQSIGKMIPGDQLRVCSTQGELTCCTSETEADMMERSRVDFHKVVHNHTNVHRQIFASRFTKLNVFVVELINRSRESLHDMFVRTYGLLYQQNAQLFTDLFTSFRLYVDGSDVDLGEVLDEFFIELMRRMFALVNDLQPSDLGSSYISCMTGRIDRLRPFGDVPEKLTTQVKRAFIAYRSLLRALAAGRDAINTLAKVEPSSSCVNALTRMSYCPYCRGLPDVRPCNTFCLNVARGCLASRADVSDSWKTYIDEMLKLASRAKGPFNIVNVVAQIDVKLSDAIMNFQDNSELVTSKIFQGCGNLMKTQKRRRRAAALNDDGGPVHIGRRHSGHWRSVSGRADRAPRSHSPTSGRSRTPRSGTDLDRLFDELTQRLQQTKDLWKYQLTSAVCGLHTGVSSLPAGTTASSAGASIEQEDTCWNGQSISRYVQPLIGEGMHNQISNNEVQLEHTRSNPIIEKVILQLRQASAALRHAFNGQEEFHVDTEGGFGSGNGDDGMDDVSGSGSGCEDDLCILKLGFVSTTTRHSDVEVIKNTDNALSTVGTDSSSTRKQVSSSAIVCFILVAAVSTLILSHHAN